MAEDFTANLKFCSRCKTVKNKAEFPRDRTKRDGYGAFCKECKGRAQIERRARTKKGPDMTKQTEPLPSMGATVSSNHGKPWGYAEDKAFLDSLYLGATVEELSEAHGRSLGSVYSRMCTIKRIPFCVSQLSETRKGVLDMLPFDFVNAADFCVKAARANKTSKVDVLRSICFFANNLLIYRGGGGLIMKNPLIEDARLFIVQNARTPTQEDLAKGQVDAVIVPAKQLAVEQVDGGHSLSLPAVSRVVDDLKRLANNLLAVSEELAAAAVSDDDKIRKMSGELKVLRKIQDMVRGVP